ncbi:hypothetical protein [Kitasatospora sp. NPDC005751]|uniref:hypothetical protein n=1 Tax=unclassified Kitasatospora TaxID=2633591 RepID=UPI0033D9000C
MTVSVRAGALRPLGLHPDQPTARAALPLAPDWWGSWTRTRRPAVRRSEVAAARRLWAAPHRPERLAELIPDALRASPLPAAAQALADLRSVVEGDRTGTPTG